jgi:hypothetical protein
MATHLRVNLGRTLFDEYSEFTNTNGPLPLEGAIDLVSQPSSAEVWNRILNSLENLQPSISKRHEISVAVSNGLETLRDLCRLSNSDMSACLRGLINEILHNQDFLSAATESNESLQHIASRSKDRTRPKIFWYSEVDYTIEEIDIDNLDENEVTSYRTRCCDVVAFQDDEGNLFCPECGGLVFFADDFLGRCSNCGMHVSDFSGRCESCGYYAGPPKWKLL